MKKKLIIGIVLCISFSFLGGNDFFASSQDVSHYSDGSIKERKTFDSNGKLEKIVRYWPNGNWESSDLYSNGVPYERRYYLPEKELNTSSGKDNYYMTKYLKSDGTLGGVKHQVAYPKVQEMNVVSWNIKTSGNPEAYFGTAGMRDYEIANAIDKYSTQDNVDLLLLQEVNDGSNGGTNQYDYLKNFGRLDEFYYVHYTGNSNIIMYNHNKFSLVEKGSYKFSVQDSYHENRYLTWAVLKDKQSGEEILVSDTHLSTDLNIAEKQLDEFLSKTNSLKSTYSTVDNVILGGDFNISTVNNSFSNNQKEKFGQYGYHCSIFNKSTKTLGDDGEIDHVCSYRNARIKSQFLENTPYDDSGNWETKREIEDGVRTGRSGFENSDITDVYYTSDHKPVRTSITYAYLD